MTKNRQKITRMILGIERLRESMDHPTELRTIFGSSEKQRNIEVQNLFLIKMSIFPSSLTSNTLSISVVNRQLVFFYHYIEQILVPQFHIFGY